MLSVLNSQQEGGLWYGEPYHNPGQSEYIKEVDVWVTPRRPIAFHSTDRCPARGPTRRMRRTPLVTATLRGLHPHRECFGSDTAEVLGLMDEIRAEAPCRSNSFASAKKPERDSEAHGPEGSVSGTERDA